MELEFSKNAQKHLQTFKKDFKLINYVQLPTNKIGGFFCVEFFTRFWLQFFFFLKKHIQIQNSSFFDTTYLESSKWNTRRSQNFSANW